MDKTGKYLLIGAVLAIIALAAYNVALWYAAASPAQIYDLTQALWRTAKLLLIIGVVGSLSLLGSLAFWASRAPRLDDRTRNEVHNATEE